MLIQSKLTNFCTAIFIKLGMDHEKAEDTSKILVEADMMGHFTHGVRLLPLYVKDIEEGNHCYLTEVPGKISPIKVDIDMRWESESLDRLYDLDSLMKIVEIY